MGSFFLMRGKLSAGSRQLDIAEGPVRELRVSRTDKYSSISQTRKESIEGSFQAHPTSGCRTERDDRQRSLCLWLGRQSHRRCFTFSRLRCHGTGRCRCWWFSRSRGQAGGAGRLASEFYAGRERQRSCDDSEDEGRTQEPARTQALTIQTLGADPRQRPGPFSMPDPDLRIGCRNRDFRNMTQFEATPPMRSVRSSVIWRHRATRESIRLNPVPKTQLRAVFEEITHLCIVNFGHAIVDLLIRRFHRAVRQLRPEDMRGDDSHHRACVGEFGLYFLG